MVERVGLPGRKAQRDDGKYAKRDVQQAHFDPSLAMIARFLPGEGPVNRLCQKWLNVLSADVTQPYGQARRNPQVKADCLVFGTNALTVPRIRWSVAIAASRQQEVVLKPAPFVYHQPKSISDVTRLLADHAAGDVRILAGGQSLVPMMAFRLARPVHLVDINGVEELAGMQVTPAHLVVGALTRHVDMQRKPVPGVTGELLRSMMPHIAHQPIRTRGTFCGSIAHADPASEWCLAAATLDAVMIAVGAGGLREIPARAWFKGAMMTALHPSELLKAVHLPLLSANTRFSFQEFSRRAGDFALAMSLVILEIDDGKMRHVRIGIGGAEAQPRRIGAAESILEAQAPSPEIFARATEALAHALDPMEDASTDANYRRNLAASLTCRALAEATA